jgi:MEMO1 family protein
VTVVSVLSPAVAGAWYPARRDELQALVDRLLEDADKRSASSAGAARAVVAPHAGYVYSGAVAASAFRSAAGFAPARIVLLGPSHHFGFSGAAVPKTASAQRTPLGDLPIDSAAIEALAESPVVRRDDRVFAPEHALEAEVPFLQRLYGNTVPIVPVLLGGGATRAEAAALAEALGPLVDEKTLLVVSSDFTHYGPRFGYVPFTERVEQRLRTLDLGAVDAMAAGDAAAFARYVDETEATICGRRAIDVLLRLPVGSSGGGLVEYDTSGRMTGDFGNSVSYASVAFPPSKGVAS